MLIGVDLLAGMGFHRLLLSDKIALQIEGHGYHHNGAITGLVKSVFNMK